MQYTPMLHTVIANQRDQITKYVTSAFGLKWTKPKNDKNNDKYDIKTVARNSQLWFSEGRNFDKSKN